MALPNAFLKFVALSWARNQFLGPAGEALTDALGNFAKFLLILVRLVDHGNARKQPRYLVELSGPLIAGMAGRHFQSLRAPLSPEDDPRRNMVGRSGLSGSAAKTADRMLRK